MLDTIYDGTYDVLTMVTILEDSFFVEQNNAFDDEDFLGYLGKYIETNIDDAEIAIFLEQTLGTCGEIVLRRMKLFFAGYSITEIAKKESVCYTSVSCSIDKAQKALAELLQNSDF